LSKVTAAETSHYLPVLAHCLHLERKLDHNTTMMGCHTNDATESIKTFKSRLDKLSINQVGICYTTPRTWVNRQYARIYV